MLASHPSADLNALVRLDCDNVAGSVTTQPFYEGCLGHVPSGLRQIYVKFEAGKEPLAECEARLEAFKTRLLPSLLTAMSSAVGNAQTLLFIPRYFDLVSICTWSTPVGTHIIVGAWMRGRACAWATCLCMHVRMHARLPRAMTRLLWQVRVRQLLVSEDVPFVAVSEYSTPSQVQQRAAGMRT